MASFTGSSEVGGAKSVSRQIISRLELVQVLCLVRDSSLTTVSVLRQLNLKIPKFAQLAQLTDVGACQLAFCSLNPVHNGCPCLLLVLIF